MASRKKSVSCVFCSIAEGEDEKTVPLYKDEEVIVFKDIKPAAPHHYLVCPNKHVKDVKALKKSDLDLVRRLVDIGKQVLQEEGGDISKARLGFHYPPFCTVYHLHLHVISPLDKISCIGKAFGKYNPKMWWFKDVDWLIKHLEELPDENPDRSTSVDASR